MTDKKSRADDLIEAGPDAPIALTDADMDKVSGGKVRTSDKQQADMLKFLKG
jgi:hypothetical protein